MANVGRPPALDYTKRREICALVSAGSRWSAVNCAGPVCEAVYQKKVRQNTNDEIPNDEAGTCWAGRPRVQVVAPPAQVALQSLPPPDNRNEWPSWPTWPT
jgi:hypothetical protein